MNPPKPLETLFETNWGTPVPLPKDLRELYGELSFPRRVLPHIISNFVTTLDGVASLDPQALAQDNAIGGASPEDRMVMGLLRASCDAVVIGGGSLRSAPGYLGTAGAIFPPLAGPYALLRSSLGKTQTPLNVIVSAHGLLDPKMRLLQSGEVPVLVVTTSAGRRNIESLRLSSSVKIIVEESSAAFNAEAILEAITASCVAPDLILVEGGPRLMGRFFADGCLDELFLTLASQVAGRDGSTSRPGFVDGELFSPECPLWGRLLSVKRGGSTLFLRYAFGS
ncbi:MAG TPA: dihydrofolate reductase family protein [Bacteroidota bacterium]|nr:dihydrofolate reductase family protein [Bacteroidota bacterium]